MNGSVSQYLFSATSLETIRARGKYMPANPVCAEIHSAESRESGGLLVRSTEGMRKRLLIQKPYRCTVSRFGKPIKLMWLKIPLDMLSKED